MRDCVDHYPCECSCHKGGHKYMKTSNPPIPCCTCDNFIGYIHPTKHIDKCKCVFCLYQIIEEIKKRISALESIFKDFPKIYAEMNDKKPYKCPCCKNGNIYQPDCVIDICKSCDGKGILWR